MPFTTRTQLQGAWESARGFLVKQWTDLYAELAGLLPLAVTIKTPYTKAALLATDSTGAAGFNRFPWITVPFATSRFSQSAGAWTLEPADVGVYRYVVLAGVMLVEFGASATTTSAGIGTELRVTLPDGWRTRGSSYVGPCFWFYAAAAGSNGQGIAYTTGTPNDNYVRLFVDTTRTTNWPASRTNDLEVYFNLTLPVYHPTLRPLIAGD